MKNKQYTLGNVTYGYSLQSKKWEFKINDFTFLTALNGGGKVGETVARLIEAGYVRLQKKGEVGIDGLARANINLAIARHNAKQLVGRD